MSRLVTKGKTFEALQRSLQRANARFRRLSKPEQRVAIAKDVIAQLRTKAIVPRSVYFAASGVALDKAEDAGLDLSEALSQISCRVCGIGSLFVAAVKKADCLKVEDFQADTRTQGEWYTEVGYLKEWFSEAQLTLVEKYYEKATYDSYDGVDERSPIHQESDARKRLQKIMENIISNSGKFDPEHGAHAIPRTTK